MKLTAMQLHKLWELEKRDAAYHEASHAAIIRQFGGHARPHIWPNPNANEILEKAWFGTCEILANPFLWDTVPEVLAELYLPPPANWAVIVGLSGYVGEHFARGIRDEDELYELLKEAIYQGELSATDLEFIGDNWSDDDLTLVMKLLLKNWSQIEAEAKQLMIYG